MRDILARVRYLRKPLLGLARGYRRVDHRGVGEDRSQTSRQRVTVAQAAEILGVTVEAVRGRIKRKTLEHERHSGTVYVLLHADQMPTGRQPGDDQTTDQPQSDSTALISAKDETIATLRDQLE